MNDFDITPNGGRRLSRNGGFWFIVKNNKMPNAEIDKWFLTDTLSIFLEKTRSTMLNRIPPRGAVPLNVSEYKVP
jgi:hypothetical protein